MKKFLLILGLISFGVNAADDERAEFRAMSKAAINVIKTVCFIHKADYKNYEHCYDLYTTGLSEEFKKELEKELGLDK